MAIVVIAIAGHEHHRGARRHRPSARIPQEVELAGTGAVGTGLRMAKSLRRSDLGHQAA
jgi:hypothetical protein